MSETMKAKVMTVTPAVAKRWLEKNHEGNRKVNPRRVERLVSDMKAGAFRLTHQGICFGANNELIDGQHRLAAVVESNVTVKMLVVTDSTLKFHSPIDRGQARSLALVTGKTTWEVAVVNLLFNLERGGDLRVSITDEDVRATHRNNIGAFNALVDVQGFTALRSGSAAAFIFAYPIAGGRIVKYARDLSSGSMLPAGHAAIAHRRWLDRQKATRFAEAMGTMSAIRHYLTGASMGNVHTADRGYRAICSKRRSMNIPNTPSAEKVAHLPLAINGSEDE